MARYTVHVKGEGPEALASARFVRDGFSWLAFLFGGFWLLAKGAWISGVLLLTMSIALGLTLNALGLAMLYPIVSLLVGYLVALESGAIRAWELGLAGYRFAGVISGDDADVMERRFFEEALAEKPAPARLPVEAPARGAGGVPVIGLFPSPWRPGGGQP